jgi:hypothetical protein
MLKKLNVEKLWNFFEFVEICNNFQLNTANFLLDIHILYINGKMRSIPFEWYQK